jgi:hypothetical protein
MPEPPPVMKMVFPVKFIDSILFVEVAASDWTIRRQTLQTSQR